MKRTEHRRQYFEAQRLAHLAALCEAQSTATPDKIATEVRAGSRAGKSVHAIALETGLRDEYVARILEGGA
jgi:hypothetical protein